MSVAEFNLKNFMIQMIESKILQEFAFSKTKEEGPIAAVLDMPSAGSK